MTKKFKHINSSGFVPKAQFTRKLKLTMVILCLAFLLIGSYIGYTFVPTPSSTFWWSSGVYPGAPSFTIWVEGTDYFAKDANGYIQNGHIQYSGTNASDVINDAINGLTFVSVRLPDSGVSVVSAPTGWIHFLPGKYCIDSPIQIPLGSRIIISGCGTTQQMIRNGINGGTQIVNSASTPALKALQKSGSVYCTGSIIYLRDIEFVQSVALASSTTGVLDLDGMAQGKLENVQVVSDYSLGGLTGVGIRLYTNNTVGDTNADTLFEQVQVCGFSTGIYSRIDHWEAHQLDIANCSLAMKWWVCIQNHLYGVHIFQVNQILEVHNGFMSYGHASIEGLYLEDIDDDTETIKWNIYTEFTGIIYIENTNVNSCDSTYLWSVNTTNTHGNCSLWFDKVMTACSTVFPSVTTPTIASATNFTNTFMQTIEVSVWSGTVTGVYVNGLGVGGSQVYGILLRPGDRISVTYSSTPSWVWRAVSAERLHYLDP